MLLSSATISTLHRSFLPDRKGPSKPTREELLQKKEEEMKLRQEREEQLKKKREEEARAAAEKKRLEREAKQFRRKGRKCSFNTLY